ncbi:MAG: class I SAM-dependent methyltransferase [Kribbellaceae bacterium]|nr:class I SAM-dependent methyltransferase [Kribbellaceae bacterium]
MIITGVAVGLFGIKRVDRRVREELSQTRTELAAQHKRLKAQLDQLGSTLTLGLAAADGVRAAVAEDRVEMLSRLAHTSEVLARFDEGFSARVARQADALELARQELQRIGSRVENVAADLTDLPAQIMVPVDEALKAASARQTRLGNRLYAKLEARAELASLVRPRVPIPPLGGWALDADVMYFIMRAVWDRRPELIVECGSGTSTLWLGYLAERLGVGSVVALEHDDRYLDTSRELVRSHGLEKIVEVRHGPLQPWTDPADDDGHTYRWYSADVLEGLTGIGLLLVDGPPAAAGPQARYPAGPLLIPRCRDDALIILDDADRTEEKTLSDRWMAAFPELERTLFAHGSAHIFQRSVDQRM